ncbi:MAG TPA: response regulator, partial [Tepidisphaeraceae bacterium]|nr:response regulator [Tepidisphaeraceae bacterium]
IGMTAEQAAGLFKPFVQVDASNTRKFGGTGLGLSICKRLSQILGGDISVSSRPGSGSKFTVTVATGDLSGIEFICPSSEAMKHDAFAAENIHADPAPHLRGRVLIAEDGLFNQEVFRFYLEEAGLEVDMVENGKLACDRFAQACANDKPFDLVIMDMQMPELDGYDATTRLRAAGVNAPIIAVTANAMSGDRERCIAVGCNDYLTKPIDRAVMLSTLKNYLPKAA